MVTLSALFALTAALSGVWGTPHGPSSYHELLERQRQGGGGSGSGSGSAGGNFYSSYWTDGGEKVNYKNGKGGEYTITWSGSKGNFVAGKGWNNGGDREVKFSGTFEPEGNAYLSIYGWTTSPLVEYYVVEAYGTHRPSDTSEAEIKGNFTSDGGEYEIFTKMRKNKPSIQGTATFAQLWSVRWGNRVGGTVTMGNHFKAWKAAGLKMGAPSSSYMIVATEGQGSNGSATITVGVAPPTPAATSNATKV